jgi:hypothetical protein
MSCESYAKNVECKLRFGMAIRQLFRGLGPSRPRGFSRARDDSLFAFSRSATMASVKRGRLAALRTQTGGAPLFANASR